MERQRNSHLVRPFVRRKISLVESPLRHQAAPKYPLLISSQLSFGNPCGAGNPCCNGIPLHLLQRPPNSQYSCSDNSLPQLEHRNWDSSLMSKSTVSSFSALAPSIFVRFLTAFLIARLTSRVFLVSIRDRKTRLTPMDSPMMAAIRSLWENAFELLSLLT